MATIGTSRSKSRPRRRNDARMSEGTATYIAPLLKVNPLAVVVEQQPPASSEASSTTTGLSLRASVSAAARPAKPAPITTTGSLPLLVIQSLVICTTSNIACRA